VKAAVGKPGQFGYLHVF